MSAEELVALLGAVAILLTAIGRCIAEVRSYHRSVNGRMDELLTLTRSAAFSRGALAQANSPVGKTPTENTVIPLQPKYPPPADDL